MAAVVLVVSCGKKSAWTPKQRTQAREMIDQWREWAYVGQMSESEFADFASRTIEQLETRYPSFVEFVAMPMAGDSVEVVMVAEIVEDLRADSHNLRRLFPYRMLVEGGILPDGLSRHQQADYYACLLLHIEQQCGSLGDFVWMVVWGTEESTAIARIMADCALPFWGL